MRQSFGRCVLAGAGATALFALAATPLGSQTPAGGTAAVSSAYANVVVPALALVEYANEQKHGTAFCVAFKGGTAYLLTAQHVIANEQTGKVEPFVVVFPGHPMQKLSGRLVRAGAFDGGPATSAAMLPDLAVIAVDGVPFPVAALAVSTATPAANVRVSLAGFPDRETDTWIRRQRTYLGVATAPGTVSDNGGPFDDADVYISYNAPTFDGESGGPLFDPETGSVLGVVHATEGEVRYSDAGLAIPAATVRKFLAGAKEFSIATYTPPPGSLAADALPAAPVRARRIAGTPRCLAALGRFSRDFAEWRQFHSAMERSRSARIAHDSQPRLRSYERALSADARRIAATSNRRTARLTNDMLEEVGRFDAVARPAPADRFLMRRAVLRSHSVHDCSPDV